MGSCGLDSRQDISGIRVQGVYIFLSLYADDTDIFTQASILCIDAIVQKLSEFGVHSGCRTNGSKNNCIPLGRARYNTSLLEDITDKFGIDFVQNTLTALGITFYIDKSEEEIVNINYNSKFEKAKSWVEI